MAQELRQFEHLESSGLKNCEAKGQKHWELMRSMEGWQRAQADRLWQVKHLGMEVQGRQVAEAGEKTKFASQTQVPGVPTDIVEFCLQVRQAESVQVRQGEAWSVEQSTQRFSLGSYT